MSNTWIGANNYSLSTGTFTTTTIDNSFCPMNTYTFTLNAPTALGDQIYAINSGTSTVTHLPYTISESCDDVYVYHSYSKVSWPNPAPGPTVAYNATTYTLTYSDTSTSDVGKNYTIKITGLLANGQSSYFTFNLVIVRECYFAGITSYDIADVSYDIS